LGNWDKIIREFEGGTLFHERCFLNYHGSRFTDRERFLVVMKGEAVVGMLPSATGEGPDTGRLISPYGSSFGGPVFKTRLTLKEAVGIMDGFQEYFRGAGITNISFTLAPAIYSSNADVLEYCLLRNGYTISKADIFSILPIGKTAPEVSEIYEGRVRTTLRKEKDQYTIRKDVDVDSFYPILLTDKKGKNTAPTHSAADLLVLKQSYPDRVRMDIASHTATGAQFAACYFRVNKEGWMTFYMAQDKKELRLSGMTVLINEFLCDMAGRYRFLDFGGSTFGYEISNIGVSDFKQSFGAQNYLRKTFSWNQC
jgi:hypothetical protein